MSSLTRAGQLGVYFKADETPVQTEEEALEPERVNLITNERTPKETVTDPARKPPVRYVETPSNNVYPGFAMGLAAALAVYFLFNKA